MLSLLETPRSLTSTGPVTGQCVTAAPALCTADEVVPLWTFCATPSIINELLQKQTTETETVDPAGSSRASQSTVSHEGQAERLVLVWL